MKGETFIRPSLDMHFAVVEKAEKIVPAVLATAEYGTLNGDHALVAKF